MVRVTIWTSEFEPEKKALVPRLLAEMTVDGFDVHVPEDYRFLLELEPLDADAGERVRFSDDPERWALLLPTAFRSGDPILQAERVPAPVHAHAHSARRW
jgi:hypothetical protein